MATVREVGGRIVIRSRVVPATVEKAARVRIAREASSRVESSATVGRKKSSKG